MKSKVLIGLFWLGTLAASPAGIYSLGSVDDPGTSAGSFSPLTIVDGNPAEVVSSTMTLSGLGSSLSDLTVTLNVSGGTDNSLYAYLVSSSGATVTLLNQPGVTPGTPFGNMGSGLNITLADGGSAITASSDLSSGTYAAASSLSTLNASDPNGTWTLNLADTIAGGGDATLNGWSLDITTVPEPVTEALALFGLCAIGFRVVRRYFPGRQIVTR